MTTKGKPPKSARESSATHDDVVHILGDLDDGEVARILALGPTVAELEEAALWAQGQGGPLGKTGHPLKGVAGQVLDIVLTVEEEQAPEPEPH